MGVITEEPVFSLTDEINLDPDIKHDLEDFSDDIFDMKIEIEGLIKDLEEDKRVVKPRRRKAASDNEDVDFLGFEKVSQDNFAQEYSKILERLEAEVDAASLSFTPLRYVMAPASAKKRPRTASDTSRSSSEQASKQKSLVASVPSAQDKPESNVTTNIISPLLLVPLERGWRRELVYRTRAHENFCDIYYYTPAGKKLRSVPDILAHLSGTGFTIENFSFCKKPLGINDPDKELVRKAKVYTWIKSVKLALKRKPRVCKARNSKFNKSKSQEPKHQTPKSQQPQYKKLKSGASTSQELISRASISQEPKSLASTSQKTISRVSTPQEPISEDPKSQASTSQENESRASTSYESIWQVPTSKQHVSRSWASTSQELKFQACKSQKPESQASTSHVPKSRVHKYQKLKRQKPGGRKRGRKPKNRLAAATDPKPKSTPTKLKKSFKSKTKGVGRRSVIVDIQSPLLRVPLERGWKRELVYRSKLDTSSARRSDVYYFTPAGKKVRSIPEILEHLSGTGLTVDNFSFSKQPMGVNDPDREVVRVARPFGAWAQRRPNVGRPRSTNSRSAQHKISKGLTSVAKKQRRKRGTVITRPGNDEETVDSDIIVN